MLFRSTDGDEEHISGVILYDETIWQKAKDGTPLVEMIKKAGSIPGIKVDEGTKPLPNCPGEVVTVGLDKLADRLPKYYEQGARFAKWRAVIDIGAGIPSYALHPRQRACARALRRALPGGADRADRRARSADGRRSRHRRCYEVTEWVLKETFQELYYQQRRARRHRAQAEHGRSPARRAASAPASRKSPRRPSRCCKNCVPGAVPGIAFLSGGQSDEEATAHLDAMNKIGGLPWPLTFSYGRALQAAPQKAWTRQGGERGRRPARLLASRQHERPRRARPVEGGAGKEGGVRLFLRGGPDAGCTLMGGGARPLTHFYIGQS